MAKLRINKDNIDSIKGETDWEEFAKLTDEEIKKRAKDDPDVAIPSEKELEEFKRVDKNE